MLKTTFKRLFIACIFLAMITGLKATHIVGGEMYYDYLGNNQYRITLKLYRDCINGQAPFGGLGDGHAIVNITGYNKELVTQVLMGVPVVSPVQPNTNNPCMQSPNGVCVEQGVYTRIVTLPPRPGGYFLVYETCCRNNTILNIINPGNQGSTYRIYIPGPELAAVNSSPRFNQMPSLYVCSGSPLNYLHSAVDPDGDSLVYSFAPAYNGFNIDTLVPYMAPFNGNYPMASSPPVSISQGNGLISGVPNIIGQWAMCVMVREFRNGKLLSTHYRDFQYNVISCNLNVNSGFADQLNKCEGAAISFTNQSFSNFGMSYYWDFGVASITSDTSTLQHPSFVFPDTGTYFVKLIVNKGLPCADSVVKKIYVYPPYQPVYAMPAPDQCIKNAVVQFSVGGNYLPQASFNFQFGNAASPPNANSNLVSVTYTAAGVYTYQLIAKQFACVDTVSGSLKFYKRPVSAILPSDSVFCAPALVKLSENSESEYPVTFNWQIHQQNYSGTTPEIYFQSAGIYTAVLVTQRQGVCPDTVTSLPFTFTLHPKPSSDFMITPTLTSIFDPEISVQSAASADATEFLYQFGDGYTSAFMNEKHLYSTPGTYTVRLSVKNKFGCESTTEKAIVIEPEFRCWVPNTFTPDDNHLNDVFKPIVFGMSDFKFDIFNRFGEVVFSTTSPDEGWDGNFKGKACPNDTYVWKISYTNELNKKHESKTGQLLLLR